MKGALGRLLALCIVDLAPKGQPFALGLPRLGTCQQVTGSRVSSEPVVLAAAVAPRFSNGRFSCRSQKWS